MRTRVEIVEFIEPMVGRHMSAMFEEVEMYTARQPEFIDEVIDFIKPVVDLRVSAMFIEAEEYAAKQPEFNDSVIAWYGLETVLMTSSWLSEEKRRDDGAILWYGLVTVSHVRSRLSEEMVRLLQPPFSVHDLNCVMKPPMFFNRGGGS